MLDRRPKQSVLSQKRSVPGIPVVKMHNRYSLYKVCGSVCISKASYLSIQMIHHAIIIPPGA